MKLHENPLAPIVLLDPDNLWENAGKQILRIAEKKYGPVFTPRMVHSCATAVDAVQVVMGFLQDPDQWYARKKIPMEDVKAARKKSREIRMHDLGLEKVEVFDRPNYRLK